MVCIKIDEKIKLEIISPFDANELFELIDFNRDYLREYLPWVDKNASSNDSYEFIKSNLIGFSEKKVLTYFIKSNLKIIGLISLFRTNRNANIYEIGYWLSENENNKGIMTKCVKEIINIGFNIINANKIEIHCATQNIGSNRIAEKVGMKKEGTIRNAEKVNDKLNDLNIYGILRD